MLISFSKKGVFTFLSFAAFTLPCQAQQTLATAQEASLFDIIVDGGLMSVLIWLMLFTTSLGALIIGIYSFHLLRKNIFSPDGLVTEVRAAMLSRDWKRVSDICCSDGDSIFAKTILNILFVANKGEQAAGEAASDTILKSKQAIARHIGTLQMCGNIAPMLGLLGTVTGMVSAFVGLGGSVGAEKASVLAIAISQALYTTAAGLFIAVPALAAAHFAKNLLERRTIELAEIVEQSTSEIWKKPLKR